MADDTVSSDKGDMTGPEEARKREFKKALIDADMTATEFAARVGKVSRTHLNRVLDDPRQSQPLTAIIDAFIREQRKPRRLAKAS